MNLAYLDPPYLGCSRLYPEHPESQRWDDPATFRGLIDSAMSGAFDGWALSCSSSSLQTMLSFCPPEVRVLAWVKPFCNWKGSANPAYAWEPVIMWGGRKRKIERPKVLDWISANAPIQKGTAGAKPLEFALWIFRCLGARPGDHFSDVFHGSGAVADAWALYCRQTDFTRGSEE